MSDRDYLYGYICPCEICDLEAEVRRPRDERVALLDVIARVYDLIGDDDE